MEAHRRAVRRLDQTGRHRHPPQPLQPTTDKLNIADVKLQRVLDVGRLHDRHRLMHRDALRLRVEPEPLQRSHVYIPVLVDPDVEPHLLQRHPGQPTTHEHIERREVRPHPIDHDHRHPAFFSRCADHQTLKFNPTAPAQPQPLAVNVDNLRATHLTLHLAHNVPADVSDRRPQWKRDIGRYQHDRCHQGGAADHLPPAPPRAAPPAPTDQQPRPASKQHRPAAPKQRPNCPVSLHWQQFYHLPGPTGNWKIGGLESRSVLLQAPRTSTLLIFFTS